MFVRECGFGVGGGVGAMKPKFPTIIEESSSREPFKAKWWRTNVVKLRAMELAQLTGYSVPAIYLMERGISADGRLVRPWVWRRYKMACAGVEYQVLHGREFEWDYLERADARARQGKQQGARARADAAGDEDLAED
jgi:hypothetical protein